MKSCLNEKEWTFSKTGGYKADFLVIRLESDGNDAIILRERLTFIV